HLPEVGRAGQPGPPLARPRRIVRVGARGSEAERRQPSQDQQAKNNEPPHFAAKLVRRRPFQGSRKAGPDGRKGRTFSPKSEKTEIPAEGRVFHPKTYPPLP